MKYAITAALLLALTGCFGGGEKEQEFNKSA
jgi:hypothetical protein